MLFLHGLGHYHPEQIIDNAFLESLDIGTADDWILQRTGIAERRTLLPLDYIRATKNADPRAAAEAAQLPNAATAAKAAALAAERARIKLSDIGLVIAGGSAPSLGSPPEACAIAAELGLNVRCFDVNAACVTFGAQLHLLNQMQASQLPDFVLIVNPENLTSVTDYRDRSTAVLMGDATTAAIISASQPSKLAIDETSHTSDPLGWSTVTIPTGGHLRQNGNAVQKFAISRTIEVLSDLAFEDGPYTFVGHQANLMMLQSICSRVGIEWERHWFNVDRFGNCGAAGAPSVLSQHWDDLLNGTEVALAVVGAGLSWSGLKIRNLNPDQRLS